MLALLTNTGYASDGPTWNVPDAGYSPHEELIDVLTCNTVYADDHGGLLVRGSHGLPQVRLSSPLSSSLYPVVIVQSSTFSLLPPLSVSSPRLLELLTSWR